MLHQPGVLGNAGRTWCATQERHLCLNQYLVSGLLAGLEDAIDKTINKTGRLEYGSDLGFLQRADGAGVILRPGRLPIKQSI